MKNKQKIISANVDISSLNEVLLKIEKWINDGFVNSKFICLFNVHMCMEAFDNKDFSKLLNQSDLNLADGFPIYLAQKLLGNVNAKHIRGTDLTLKLCNLSKENDIPIGFIGGTQTTLDKMIENLQFNYHIDNIRYNFSPPFRELNQTEENKIIKDINDSKIKILFVGLGCPKQEFWMYKHIDNLNCIMLGVGAAFDFIAGNKKEAPVLMQKFGLEWIYRFLSEPKRLWRRYLKHNPRFIYYFIKQYLMKKRS